MTTATITPAEFEKAVRLACVQRATRYASMYPTLPIFVHGDQHAVRYGPFLREIAAAAGVSVPMARRRMRKLESQGRVLRDDREGGCTSWWLVGLTAELRPEPIAPASPPVVQRQTLTHSTPVPARQHWSDVLGVPRDCSTSEARAAFQSAVAALDQADPDYPNQSRRVRDAIDACCRDHEIQIEE
jgi:hypothetical protein